MKKSLCFFLICIGTFKIQAKTFPPTSSSQLCFIENKGQVKDQHGNPRKDIQYSLRGQGMTIFIGNGQMHYQFSNSDACLAGKKDLQDNGKINLQHKGNGARKNQAIDIESNRVDVALIGANKNAVVVAEEEQAYYENYYFPGCPENGIQAHTYTKLTYKNILPGIDWVIRIKEGKPEHEFVVNDGGDASAIQLKYSGQSSLKINANGSITVTTPMGIINEHAPVCYLPDGTKVSSSFALKKNILSYNINRYEGALVIDPVLEWGTYYGIDSSSTFFYAITTDDSAHVYACGATYSGNVGTVATTGAFQTVYGGNEDGFLVKFDSSGHRLWGTYYGGSQIDWASSVTCDHAGNVYLAGSSSSAGGIATPGTQEPTFVGGQWDGYLAKFNSAGTRQWGTYVGGTDSLYYDVEIGSISCDTLGHIYVSGSTDDTDHISTPGCWKYIKSTHVNHYDCFLQQYNTATGVRIWGTYYGGDHDDMDGVCISDGNYVYLAGYTFSDTGIASIGSYQAALDGVNSDAFIAKFDASGHRMWGTYYGGPGQDQTGGIALGGGYIYLFGSTNSDAAMASSGCFQPLRAGGLDAFIAQFVPETGYRQWGTYYGGAGDEITNESRITADDTGNVYVTGYTNSTTGMASASGWKTDYGGGTEDVFFAKYNNLGNQVWATYYGGSGSDQGWSCTYDGRSIYICGQTNSTDSIATPGSFLSTGGGLTFYTQGFIAKFADPPPLPIHGRDSICIGDTTTFSDGSTGGTWSSGNTAIATAGAASGLITGIAPGTAIITYTIPTGTTATRTITVNPFPAPITGSDTLCYGLTDTLSDSDPGGKWKSSYFLIANIDSVIGSIKGISPGVAIITYTLPTGCYITTTDTVVICAAGVPVLTRNGNDIEIHPNPAISELAITSGDKIVSVSIKNLLGQVVYSCGYSAASVSGSIYRVQVDVADMPAGIYFVIVNDVPVKRFVKQ